MNKIKVPTVVVVQPQSVNLKVPYPSTLYLKEEIELEVHSSFEKKSKKSKWYIDNKGHSYHQDFIYANYRNLDIPCTVWNRQSSPETTDYPLVLNILTMDEDPISKKIIFSTMEGKQKYDVSTILEKYIF